ncbi:hypothetical protein NMY22_g12066 [Coprinellus aureogranulatus]|nr:hypothetical protein NMY22_g12066 [Coprinellus aureogranulatus]
MPTPSALNLPPLPAPLTAEVRANVVKSFKLQDNMRRRRAAKAQEEQEPVPYIPQLGRDELQTSQKDGLENVDTLETASVSDSIDSEESISYGQAAANKFDAFCRAWEGSHTSLSLMSNSDADAMLLSLREEEYFDSWPANDYQKFVVYSRNACQWNAICQYVKVKKRSNQRRLKLKLNKPPTGELSHRKGKPYPVDWRLESDDHPRMVLALEWVSYLFVTLLILAMCSSLAKFILGDLTSVLPQIKGYVVSALRPLIPAFEERIIAPAKAFLISALRRLFSTLERTITMPAKAFLASRKHSTLSFFFRVEESALVFISQLPLKLKNSHTGLKRDLYRRLQASLEVLLEYLKRFELKMSECKDLNAVISDA